MELEAAVVDWTSAAATDELAGRGPFDLVLAADVLYERPTVARMLSLLPRLAPAAWLADPSRPTAAVFLDQARRRGWTIDSAARGVVDLHRHPIPLIYGSGGPPSPAARHSSRPPCIATTFV